MWARAVWDGTKVDVDCRCDANHGLAGELQIGGEWTPITNWTVDADGRVRAARDQALATIKVIDDQRAKAFKAIAADDRAAAAAMQPIADRIS